MALLNLPSDLLLAIADFSPQSSINALLQSSKGLCAHLNYHLYYLNIRDSHSNALLWASLHGDINVVRRLLDQGADVNTNSVRAWEHCVLPETVTKGGKTALMNSLQREVSTGHSFGNAPSPLMYAAAGGYTDIMELLIQHGADLRCNTVNEANTNGYSRLCHRTPIMMAADRGHPAAVEVLLRHGVNINTPLVRCNTPLSLAVMHGRLEVVRTLLAYGVDVNVSRRAGSPLMKAARGGHLEVVRVLLDEGKADITITNASGYDAIYMAVCDNHPDIITMLVEHGWQHGIDLLQQTDGRDYTLLTIAALNRSVEAIERLLFLGADINATDDNNQTPLWCARDHAGATEMLLRHGADPETTQTVNDEIIPVLIAAIESQDYCVAEVLVEHGANTNCKTILNPNDPSVGTNHPHVPEGGYYEKTRTPLWLAAKVLHIPFVRKLIQYGADPNTRGGANATTPLYWAIEDGHITLATILLDNGADPNAPIGRGRGRHRLSPLRFAMQQNQRIIAQILVDHGADPNQKGPGCGPLLVRATVAEDVGLTKTMLEKGADPNVKTKRGKSSPLFVATMKKNPFLTRLLLAYGAKHEEECPVAEST